MSAKATNKLKQRAALLPILRKTPRDDGKSPSDDCDFEQRATALRLLRAGNRAHARTPEGSPRSTVLEEGTWRPNQQSVRAYSHSRKCGSCRRTTRHSSRRTCKILCATTFGKVARANRRGETAVEATVCQALVIIRTPQDVPKRRTRKDMRKCISRADIKQNAALRADATHKLRLVDVLSLQSLKTDVAG